MRPGPNVAPTPSAVVAVPGPTKPTQAVVFICLSLAVFMICVGVLSILTWFMWRKAQRNAGIERSRRAEIDNDKEEGSVKKQVRLPVVIINPDDDVEYGRKDSRYFPSLPADGVGKHCAELPQTPPPGAYYIEGTPGFFEVNVEIGEPLKTPPAPPQNSPKSPTNLLSAALAKLSPRTSKSSLAATSSKCEGPVTGNGISSQAQLDSKMQSSAANCQPSEA